MAIYNLKKDDKDERDIIFSQVKAEAALPSFMDIRNLCPLIYDQGNQGSCTANAGCAARVMLLGKPSLDLSRAFLYYCERSLEGTTDQDSGASIRDICKAANKFGICEEAFMPYNDVDYTTAPSKEARENAVNYKINAYNRLNSLYDIKTSIAVMKKPVIIGMDVFESMESAYVASTGKLTMPEKREQNLGGHAVLVVGYNDKGSNGCSFVRSIYNRIFKKSNSIGYLIIRNSWGSSWGDKGYFYMPYEYFEKYSYDYWIME